MSYQKQNHTLKYTVNKSNGSLTIDSLSEFSSIYFLSLWRNIPINEINNYIPMKVQNELIRTFKHLVEITQFPYQCVLISTYYLYILSKKHPELKGYGSEINLMVMALMATNKMFYDNTYSNKTWSEISNIPLNELNIMELEFYEAMDFNLNIDIKNFYIWENYINTAGEKFERDSNMYKNIQKTTKYLTSGYHSNVQSKINYNPPSPIAPVTPTDKYVNIQKNSCVTYTYV